MLMRELRRKDPVAAASYDWPLWALASKVFMTMPELHARMLELSPGIRHMLIGSFTNGRFLRWPTDRRREIEWMQREKSIDALAAILALLREAELVQDPATYADAYLAMLDLLPVLRGPATAMVAAELGAYLVERFGAMNYIVSGAYESHPASIQRSPVMIKLEELTQEAVNEFEQNWKEGDPGAGDSEVG
jgi:hypothetical protein